MIFFQEFFCILVNQLTIMSLKVQWNDRYRVSTNFVTHFRTDI